MIRFPGELLAHSKLFSALLEPKTSNSKVLFGNLYLLGLDDVIKVEGDFAFLLAVLALGLIW